MQRIAVMHIIDGLATGGAERMVVNLVNTLPRDRFRPLLCTSRFDGRLASTVDKDVGWIRLNRRHRFDVRAIFRLAELLDELNVQIIHAHSTSLFLAVAARALHSGPRVIWHDHYGPPAGLLRNRWVYGSAARRTDAVISVSEALVDWTRDQLGVPGRRVRYIPNFVCNGDKSVGAIDLPGEEGARIACVAGIRPEKDLASLMNAMETVSARVPAAHLLLVGPVRDAAYWGAIEKEIEQRKLQTKVTWLGERSDISAILGACDIGVLSSRSEGFPVTLLEYGRAQLAVASTSVGQCAEVLAGGRAGILVPPENPSALSDALVSLLMSTETRQRLGGALSLRVKEHYSPEHVLDEIADLYAEVLKT